LKEVDQDMSVVGVLVLAVVVVAATAYGLVRRRRSGALREAPAVTALSADDLGVPLGERATLLQFSSAFCAPCRATKRILSDVAAAVPGVRHVEVDAESNLELVRRLNILKTPTTLVLDGQGRVTKRAAGQPRKEHILAALENAVG